MIFSELSPKIGKICPSAVKMTYDSKHAVWVEIDLFYSDIQLAKNGRVDRNERIEVHSAIFSQMGFSAKRGRIKMNMSQKIVENLRESTDFFYWVAISSQMISFLENFQNYESCFKIFLKHKNCFFPLTFSGDYSFLPIYCHISHNFVHLDFLTYLQRTSSEQKDTPFLRNRNRISIVTFKNAYFPSVRPTNIPMQKANQAT
jgi:hypothetical protein